MEIDPIPEDIPERSRYSKSGHEYTNILGIAEGGQVYNAPISDPDPVCDHFSDIREKR